MRPLINAARHPITKWCLLSLTVWATGAFIIPHYYGHTYEVGKTSGLLIGYCVFLPAWRLTAHYLRQAYDRENEALERELRLYRLLDTKPGRSHAFADLLNGPIGHG